MLVDEDDSNVCRLGEANEGVLNLSYRGLLIHNQIVRFSVFIALAHSSKKHTGDGWLLLLSLTSSPIAATKNCLFLKFLTLDDILDI